MAGCTLRRMEDDLGNELFVVTMGALTKHFSALQDVEAWLDRLGGRS